MGAYVSVWGRSPTRERAVVAIGLLDPAMPAPFNQVFAERRCEALSCQQAVREAVQEVLASWPERGGTDVSLVGAPSGALVFDNGQLVGRLPLSLRLPRGAHVMRVVAEGYEPEELALVSGGPEPQRLEIHLSKKEGAESPETQKVRKPWMVAVGSVLAVAGATMVGVGASRFRRSLRERNPVHGVYDQHARSGCVGGSRGGGARWWSRAIGERASEGETTMRRGLCVIAVAALIGGADCARETVSCPEGTAIPDFDSGGRECVPIGPDGGLGGTGGMGDPESARTTSIARSRRRPGVTSPRKPANPASKTSTALGSTAYRDAMRRKVFAWSAPPRPRQWTAGRRAATQPRERVATSCVARVPSARPACPTATAWGNSPACRCGLETCRFVEASVSRRPARESAPNPLRFPCQSLARACRVRRRPSTAE